MTYIKINGTTYPAEISGKYNDINWEGRPSKTIHLEMTPAVAAETFVDDVAWSIIEDSVDEDEQPIQIEHDNSEYCVAGPITDYRNGTVSVKMGKIMDGELLAILTGGAD